MSPGLEGWHLTVGLRERFGIVPVCHSPHSPARSLPGLAEFISAAMLKSPRLSIAGNIHIHPETVPSGAVLEFMDSMRATDLSQHVTCPMHSVGHSLDLVLPTTRAESDLKVQNAIIHPLSWTDRFLLRFNLSMATPLHRDNGLSFQAS